MIAIVAIAVILSRPARPISAYFDGAQFVYFLLGPATVAIALPLYKNWPTVRRKALPMLAALVAGATTAIVSAVAVAAAWDVPRTVLISLAPKSVTAAVAMSISDHLGGMPALTAVLVAITGVLGRRHRDPADERHGIARLCGAGLRGRRRRPRHRRRARLRRRSARRDDGRHRDGPQCGVFVTARSGVCPPVHGQRMSGIPRINRDTAPERLALACLAEDRLVERRQGEAARLQGPAAPADPTVDPLVAVVGEIDHFQQGAEGSGWAVSKLPIALS
jgi:hypothetical protein